MYSANSLLNVAFFKINFGQDKFQRGIRFAYRAFYAFPVVGLPRIRSQATTAHFSISAFFGRRISAALNEVLIKNPFRLLTCLIIP